MINDLNLNQEIIKKNHDNRISNKDFGLRGSSMIISDYNKQP